MNKIRNIEFAQYGVSNFHPLALIFLLAMAGVAVRSNRSLAALAVLATSVLMPMDQRLVVATFFYCTLLSDHPLVNSPTLFGLLPTLLLGLDNSGSRLQNNTS